MQQKNLNRGKMLKIDHDFHVHTFLSSCCSDERQLPVNIIPVVKKLGIEKIGFTDHLWANPEYTPHEFYLPQTEKQISRYTNLLNVLEGDGLRPLICHRPVSPGLTASRWLTRSS